MYPYGLTVTVRRRTRDNFGDSTAPVFHTIAGCVKWPRSSTEAADFNTAVSTGYMLSVPVGADLLATDEVLLPGDPPDGWWQVEGDPLPWGPSPFTGREPGIIVALKRSTG